VVSKLVEGVGGGRRESSRLQLISISNFGAKFTSVGKALEAKYPLAG